MTEVKHTPTLEMHPLPWSLDAEEACILDATGDAVQHFEEADERECEYHALIVSAVNAYAAAPEPPAHDDTAVKISVEAGDLLKALAERAEVSTADYFEALLHYAASITIRPGSWEANQPFNIHAYGPEGFADRWFEPGRRFWEGRL